MMNNKSLQSNRYRIAAASILLAVGTCAAIASDFFAPASSHASSNTLGTVVRTVKNGQGLTTSETDVNGKVMTYLYDHDGNLLAKILPDRTKVAAGS